MRRTFTIAALAIATLLSASCASTTSTQASSENKATPAADQSAAPRQRYRVAETQVKPGLGPAYQEFIKKETLPALQKAGVKTVGYYTSAGLGGAGWFVSIRPVESLAEFDEPNPIVKALGEAGAKAWETKRTQMIAGGRAYIMEARPELSIEMKPNEVAKLVFVTRSSVAPGRATDFENWIKNDTLPIIKKTNPKGYFVSKVGLGGDNNEYHTVIFADTFADYEKWGAELRKEGYNNVAPKLAGVVLHRESAAYRFLPELSLPQPAIAQKK